MGFYFDFIRVIRGRLISLGILFLFGGERENKGLVLLDIVFYGIDE